MSFAGCIWSYHASTRPSVVRAETGPLQIGQGAPGTFCKHNWRTVMTTLYDHMTRFHRHDCRKHNLADDLDGYVDQKMNELSQAEMLKELSRALDELFPFWLANHDQ